MSTEQPLSELARSLMDADSRPETPQMYRRSHEHVDVHEHAHEHVHEHAHEEGNCYGWWAFLFYWIVLALFFYFVYFALRPEFVLKKCDYSKSGSSSEDFSNDEIDNGRLLGAAIVTALVLIFVFWLFWWVVSY